MANRIRWQALLNASRQVLFAFHSGDSMDLSLACEIQRDIAAAVASLTDTPGYQLLENKLSKPAMTVATVAALTSLAGPDIEQASSSGSTLATLGAICHQVIKHASSEAISRESSVHDEEMKNQATLLIELSRLPPATGVSVRLEYCR